MAWCILRESILWVVFVIIVAIVCAGHTTMKEAQITNNAIKHMLGKGDDGDTALEDVSRIHRSYAVTMATIDSDNA